MSRSGIVATPDGMVVELPSLDGDGYEAWVAGLDPDTGEPRGPAAQDAGAVRFVEVVVNGPKSWSLAAELHPDVAAAYESAQDRAAAEIIGWLAQHATTRVGPRGGQVAVPVERFEAVMVRHYTSRAGDPHRHLHLQVNARVFAAGKWRGLDTVACTRLDRRRSTGSGMPRWCVTRNFVPRSPRMATHSNATARSSSCPDSSAPVLQTRGADRREPRIGTRPNGERRTPAKRAGPGARRLGRAGVGRGPPRQGRSRARGADLRHRWLTELADLGYRKPTRPVQLALDYPATIDRATRGGRDRVAAGCCPVGLECRRHPRRGQSSSLPALALSSTQRTRWELAADLTARATAGCVPLARDVPGHVRALTSPAVLAVEDDVTTRFARRADSRHVPMEPGLLSAFPEQALDGDQLTALRLVLSGHRLVVIEGAAGAGKTTLLAEVRRQLDMQGEDLLVVTPTLKAAQVVATETHATAGSRLAGSRSPGRRWVQAPCLSAAWLVHQYGWRSVACIAGRRPRRCFMTAACCWWMRPGWWIRTMPAPCCTSLTRPGPGWCWSGDRRQLPAVGRGGVLDLARAAAVQAGAAVTLGGVHRFTLTTIGPDGDVTVPDVDYAALTLAMRDGRDPDAVFAALAGGTRSLGTTRRFTGLLRWPTPPRPSGSPAAERERGRGHA